MHRRTPPRASNGALRVAIGCVDAVPLVVRPGVEATTTRCARRSRSARHSTRPPTCTPRASTAATSPRWSSVARDAAGDRESEAADGRDRDEPRITVTVNGTAYEREVEARKLLIHFIRDDLDLTGSHIGCDTGNCGACSVIVDGVLVKSCMLLAVQADGADDRDRRGARRRRRADAAPAGLQRASRAPVRLLHAGDADERDRAARARTRARPTTRSEEGAPGQHLPLHRLLEHHQGGQGASAGVSNDDVVTPEKVERRRRSGWAGQSVPRKEDSRLVQGQGVFVDDIKRHDMGFAHFVRSPYAHAHIKSVDVSAARGAPGRLRDAHRRRGRDAHRPVLPALDAARQRRSRTTRSPSAARASSATRSRSSSPRRASSRATPPSSSRSSTSRSPPITDARHAQRRRRAGAPPRRRLEPRLGGRLRVGRAGRRGRRGRPDRQDLRAPLRPLQLDAARDATARSSSTTAAPGSGRSTRTTSSPASPRS